MTNLQDRISESTEKFNQQQAQREEYLKAAEDCQIEMTKLQGEYRVLKELEEDEVAATESKKPNKKAMVIEAVTEGQVV